MGTLDNMFKTLAKSATDPETQSVLQGTGLIGLALYSNQKAKEEQLEQQPKPGPWCPATCRQMGLEGCNECKRLQEVAITALKELENVEQEMNEIKNNPVKAHPTNLPENCSLCGAPIEYDTDKVCCHYCGTPYPKEVTNKNIFGSEFDREQYLLVQMEETYNKYVEFEIYRMGLAKPQAGDTGFFSKIGLGEVAANITSGLTEAGISLLKMNGEQIKEGAAHYGVSCLEYLRGIPKQKYNTLGGINLEKNRQEMNERAARNMEIERERQEKLRQQRNASFQQQMNSFGVGHSKSYDYSGGADRSCGNCAFYMNGSSHCAREDKSTTAGDYCALWKLK